ncbi:MAG: formylglycine-generating enzyme family protein [Treponema sp.]|nr:formylglycine-generating enzyme family protein [Treponema sp.]
MKNLLKFFGIIVVMAVIIFSFGSCSTVSNDWRAQSPETIGIEMVWIPAGTFIMGSPATEKGRDRYRSDEDPQREVTLSGFYMGVYQVTQEQYQAVMGTNPSHFHGGRGREPSEGEIQERRPVENIRWFETLIFANRLSIIEGLSPAYRIYNSTNPDDWGKTPSVHGVEIVAGSSGYRLPTEAQWEYACRAGTTTAFNNGIDDWEDKVGLDPIGWFWFNSRSRTHEVGKKAPNAWGLNDMHGNVWEWCWDRHRGYPSESQTDPTGPSDGAFRVTRGGGYDSDQHARSANRVASSPTKKDRYSKYQGFRLVRPGVGNEQEIE